VQSIGENIKQQASQTHLNSQKQIADAGFTLDETPIPTDPGDKVIPPEVISRIIKEEAAGVK
jgi:hypothetical protein